MKKVFVLILLVILIISQSFAIKTYKLDAQTFKKVNIVSQKIIQGLKKKYPDVNQRKYITWVIIDSIDGYIALHPNLSPKAKIVLLIIKSKLLEYLHIKFTPSYEVVVDNSNKS